MPRKFTKKNSKLYNENIRGGGNRNIGDFNNNVFTNIPGYPDLDRNFLDRKSQSLNTFKANFNDQTSINIYIHQEMFSFIGKFLSLGNQKFNCDIDYQGEIYILKFTEKTAN